MGGLKKGRLRAGGVALALLVAGILVAANVISQRFFVRYDLTEDRRHSIAPATIAVLEGMDDVVNVDVWFSRDLPPYLVGLRRQVEDILAEYRAYAGGNLAVQFRDPGDDPVTREKLRSLGIPEVQLEILEKDQFVLTTAYMGIALLYGGRKEVIPMVQNTARLEYELTSAIVRLTAAEKKVVGWLSGASGPGLPPGSGPLKGEIGRFYDLRDVDPGTLGRVPAEVRTLVVESPRDLSREARFALDQFIMGGGRALFLVDHFDLQAGGIYPAPLESGVHDLLEHYGVRVNRDVAVEPFYNAQASFSSGFMQFRLPYPYWPRIPRDFLNGEHPVTADLEALVLPWTSSLEVLAGDDRAVRAETLAASSPDSWTVRDPYNFSPQSRVQPPMSGEERGERPLAVLLHGRFRSFWEGKEPPPAAGDEEAEAVTVVPESPETSILVIGSSRLAREEFLGRFPGGAVFLMNAVDWMTFGDDLIGIRSRRSGERRLPELPERTKAALKFGNIILLPAALALFGLFTLLARRRRRRAH